MIKAKTREAERMERGVSLGRIRVKIYIATLAVLLHGCCATAQ